MAIATGIAKVVSFKKQSGLGTASSGSGGTSLSRTTSTLDLSKATYTSNNINTSQQRSDFRHGVRSVSGNITSDLIVGHHQLLEASMLRNSWQTATTTTALIDLAAVASGSKFTRGSGSFITDGFKIGDVVRQSGFTGGAAALTGNFLVTSVSALEMAGIFLNGAVMVDDAAGESVTIATVGKKTYVPTASHVKDYYTFEHWYSDIAQSEVFTDCILSQMNVSLPPSGMATVDFSVMGINQTVGTSQVLTTPSAAANGGNLAAINGAVIVNGTQVALLTGLDFSVNGNVTAPGGVVGSNVEPDIFTGTVDVTGNMTVFFTDATMRDYFRNETEVSVIAAFTSSNDADADFKCYVFPRVKVGGASKNDGETGLVQTMPFTALENTTAGSSVLSTISIQDSLAA